MAFNSTLPVDHSQIVAAELRNQFNALKALYDAQQAAIDALQAQLDLTSGDLGALQTTVNDYIASHP